MSQSFLTFVGTYTNTTSKGIYAYRFETRTGELTALGLAAETPSPSFLAVHPNGRFLYAVNEVSTFRGHAEGSVAAFAIDAAQGKLKLLSRVSTKTTGPCHLAVDPSGRMLVVANYSGASVESYQIRPDGSLSEAVSFLRHTGSGVNPKRQQSAHAHMAIFAPGGKFVFVPDLGTDTVVAYRPDPAKATLAPLPALNFKVKPGTGPRHVAFSPGARFVYVLGEMGSTVTAFAYDANTGKTKEIEVVSTLPANYKGESTTAEIFLDPKGRHLYASNRGHDSIAVFSVDTKTGKLTLVEHTPTAGRTPRSFDLDPSGTWIVAANQDSDNLVPFRIDPQSGKLARTGKILPLGRPVCVVFVPVK